MGDDKYTRFGIIPSAARAGGSVIEGTKMLRVMVMARRKMPKSAQNIFNNQQRLVVAMEAVKGWRGWVLRGPPTAAVVPCWRRRGQYYARTRRQQWEGGSEAKRRMIVLE
jgi:hypothetical protein